MLSNKLCCKKPMTCSSSSQKRPRETEDSPGRNVRAASGGFQPHSLGSDEDEGSENENSDENVDDIDADDDDDNSTEDTAPTFKMMEDGSETMSREETAQLAARQQKFIQSLENALLRIKNKTYGVCRVTNKLIPKERLRLVPHATLSIEAKQRQ